MVINSALTKELSSKIEMVQKKAFAIILSSNYDNYDSALLQEGLERLDKRQHDISLRFALKCIKSSQHKSMFPATPNFRENMRSQKPFKEFLCNTSHYFKSPIPYLARLLNKEDVASHNNLYCSQKYLFILLYI